MDVPEKENEWGRKFREQQEHRRKKAEAHRRKNREGYEWGVGICPMCDQPMGSLGCLGCGTDQRDAY